MKETQFIKQNKEKWQRLEEVLKQPNAKADELSDLFVQVTDDLSYSRTFYPNRSIRAYLNWLAQRLFFKIYRAKKIKKNTFVNFWTEELPQIMYESRWEVLLAFSIFVLTFFIGALSQSMDSNFANTILGSSYVEMTIRNIEKGDPLAVYKSSGPFGMSMAIISNNLYVAFLTFILGVFASIGAIGILIRNGVMVGVFQYFFYERGLLGESFLTIWMHGAIEISSIILAGAAGIVMGKGLLFPGTYHRMKAFQITAQRGLKIYLGIVPAIIVAGIIEGYITRLTHTPDIIRLLFILLSFAFMIGYYVIFPIIKHRRGFRNKNQIPYLQPDNDTPVQLNIIKPAGVIFTDALSIYRRYGKAILKFSAGLAFFFVLVIFSTSDQAIGDIFHFAKYFGSAMSTLNQLLNFEEIYPYINAFAFGGVAWFTSRIISSEKNKTPLSTKIDKNILIWILAIIPALAFQYLISFIKVNGALILFMPTMAPIILSVCVGLFYAKPNPLSAFIKGPKYVLKHYWVEISIQTIMLIMGFMLISLASSSILYFLIYLFGMNFQADNQWLSVMTPIIFTFLAEWMIFITFFGFTFVSSLTWFSAREIAEATSLRKTIQKIGTEKRIKGMLRE